MSAFARAVFLDAFPESDFFCFFPAPAGFAAAFRTVSGLAAAAFTVGVFAALLPADAALAPAVLVAADALLATFLAAAFATVFPALADFEAAFFADFPAVFVSLAIFLSLPSGLFPRHIRVRASRYGSSAAGLRSDRRP
ncbi:hypothetical protein [Microbaculum marinum]|uniref:Uncharacterized protein n=1 Tax=Microbaculum marinum TaxID=1764581 RepID=A0AAW9RJ44_9HYPH